MQQNAINNFMSTTVENFKWMSLKNSISESPVGQNPWLACYLMDAVIIIELQMDLQDALDFCGGTHVV